MNHRLLQGVLLGVVIFLFVGSPLKAQPGRSRAKSRNVRAQIEKQTKSFLVRDFSPAAITLNVFSEPQISTTVQQVPKHRYVRVPKGRYVPNKYRSPALTLFDFRSEPAVIKNVVVLPGGGLNNQVSEPTVAVKGNLVFYTANHFAAFSTDGGTTYSYVSPWQAFERATGGRYSFCCDQEVQYVPQIDMFVWSLQANDFAAQLLLYATPAGVTTNTWRSILFTPTNLGVEGADLDYTDLAFGNNMLYWSTNVFASGGNSSVVVRIPLEGLRNGNPQPQASKRRWGVRLVQNTGDAGYFAAHIDSSSLYLYKWDETAADPIPNRVVVPSWNEVQEATWGPSQSRILGATRAGDELWLTWSADERSPDRPTKYAQVARIDARTSPSLIARTFGIPTFA